jgi:hypothetical protein
MRPQRRLFAMQAAPIQIKVTIQIVERIGTEANRLANYVA